MCGGAAASSAVLLRHHPFHRMTPKTLPTTASSDRSGCRQVRLSLDAGVVVRRSAPGSQGGLHRERIDPGGLDQPPPNRQTGERTDHDGGGHHEHRGHGSSVRARCGGEAVFAVVSGDAVRRAGGGGRGPRPACRSGRRDPGRHGRRRRRRRGSTGAPAPRRTASQVPRAALRAPVRSDPRAAGRQRLVGRPDSLIDRGTDGFDAGVRPRRRPGFGPGSPGTTGLPRHGRPHPGVGSRVTARRPGSSRQLPTRDAAHPPQQRDLAVPLHGSTDGFVHQRRLGPVHAPRCHLPPRRRARSSMSMIRAASVTAATRTSPLATTRSPVRAPARAASAALIDPVAATAIRVRTQNDRRARCPLSGDSDLSHLAKVRHRLGVGHQHGQYNDRE